MSRGIFIYALGHHMYGSLALNLAVTLKACDPTVKICVGYNGDSLKDLRSRGDMSTFFDEMVEVPEEAFMRNGQHEYQRAKLHILDCSPFDDTLLLDADMAWLWRHGRSPADLMDSLAKKVFAIQSGGYVIARKKLGASMMWAHPNDIADTWDLVGKKMYRIFTECVWIKKTPEMYELMELARHIYDDPKVKFLEFAGGVPDELPLMIAMATLGVKPHKDPFYPIYWKPIQKMRNVRPDMLAENFYALSIGGKRVSEQIEVMYNEIVNGAFQVFELENPYKYVPKKAIIPLRKAV